MEILFWNNIILLDSRLKKLQLVRYVLQLFQ